MKSMVFLLLLTSCLSFAEDIYLKDGKLYKNVKIADDRGKTVFFVFNDKELFIAAKDIEVIDYNKEYIESEEGILTKWESLPQIQKPVQAGGALSSPCNNELFLQLSKKDSLTKDEMKVYADLKRQCDESQKLSTNFSISPRRYTITKRPLSWMLPLGLISGGFSFFFFKKAYDENAKTSYHYSEMGKNYGTLGLSFAALGLGLTVLSFTTVEVEATNRGYAINYKYKF